MKWPFISVVTITHGRVSHLENAIQSFLNQEYPGRKELVVFNDCEEQVLKLEVAGVNVVNSPLRFPTVASLRNSAVNHTDGDVIVTLDDDDTMMPYYLRDVAVEITGRDYCQLENHFLWDGQTLRLRCKPTNLVAFRYTAFLQVQGYTLALNSGQDADFLWKLSRNCSGRTVKTESPQFIIGWTSDVAHLSNIGRDAETGRNGRALFRELTKARIERGEIPIGMVHLVPKLERDWSEAARVVLEQNHSVLGHGTKLVASGVGVVKRPLLNREEGQGEQDGGEQCGTELGAHKATNCPETVVCQT